MKVTAFFLKVGSVDLELPNSIDLQDKEKLREAAEEEIAKLSNVELLEAMSMSYSSKPIEDLIFEDVPYIESIELKDNNLTQVFQTKLWRTYKELDEIDRESNYGFIAIWSDDNGNGTFGVLGESNKTKEEVILEILKDIRINEYIESSKLGECESALRENNELSIPGIISYRIASI